MVMLSVHALFVALIVGTQAFFTWLAVINRRHSERTTMQERDWLEERLDVSDPERLLNYQRLKTGLSQLRAWIGVAVLLVVLYSGLFADAVAALAGLGLHPVLEGTVAFVAVAVALQVFSYPFDLVDTFAVEDAYEFNEQSPQLWLRDAVVGLAINAVLVGVVGAALFAAVGALPEWWWVAGVGIVAVFSLVFMILVPRVIMPLFYDFERIESGELRDAVDEVFERAGFSCEQVYEMDASTRSTKSNAMFAGFGRAKRVILFDTLIESMEIPEIQSVLAHELAHWKRHHVWKMMGISVVQAGIVFAVLGYLVDTEWLYAAFGVPQVTYAGLLLGALWVRPITRLTSPLRNRLYLKYEREADAFALEVMGDPKPEVEALAKLAGDNLSDPFPHPWYAAFHHTHPPIPERIRTALERSDEEPSEPEPEAHSAS